MNDGLPYVGATQTLRLRDIREDETGPLVDDAEVTFAVTGPTGAAVTVSTIDENAGVFRATWTPAEAGWHRIAAEAETPDGAVMRTRAAVEILAWP